MQWKRGGTQHIKHDFLDNYLVSSGNCVWNVYKAFSSMNTITKEKVCDCGHARYTHKILPRATLDTVRDDGGCSFCECQKFNICNSEINTLI